MKTIKYKLANGKVVDIEVTDEVAEVYTQIIKYEKKVYRKETRRHNSLESMQESGYEFAEPDSDVESVLERETQYAEETELDRLESEREEVYLNRKKVYLDNHLTHRQAQAYFEFTYLHLKKVRIAENMGVTEGAVRKLVLKAKENLKKLRKEECVIKSVRKKTAKNILLSEEEKEALNLRFLQALFEIK